MDMHKTLSTQDIFFFFFFVKPNGISEGEVMISREAQVYFLEKNMVNAM